MFYLKFITPKMWKLSWFSTFLLDYRGRTVCIFYVLEIFSSKPWFWIYFLSSRMTGFTTFCTSAPWGYFFNTHGVLHMVKLESKFYPRAWRSHIQRMLYSTFATKSSSTLTPCSDLDYCNFMLSRKLLQSAEYCDLYQAQPQLVTICFLKCKLTVNYCVNHLTNISVWDNTTGRAVTRETKPTPTLCHTLQYFTLGHTLQHCQNLATLYNTLHLSILYNTANTFPNTANNLPNTVNTWPYFTILYNWPNSTTLPTLGHTLQYFKLKDTVQHCQHLVILYNTLLLAILMFFTWLHSTTLPTLGHKFQYFTLGHTLQHC